MKRNKTPFGIYYSTLRKSRNQSITKAAELLDVSVGYISRVEYGDKEIPVDWADKIIKIYNLKQDEIRDLNTSIKETPSVKRVSLKEVEICEINLIENVISDPKERELLIRLTKERLAQFKK